MGSSRSWDGMPSSTVVIALEGVLCGKDDHAQLTQEPLQPLAHLLYASFARTSRLVLATNNDRLLVEHWCRQFGLGSHQSLTPLDERTVLRLRAGGDNVELYIDSNADRAAAAVRNGVATMLFQAPLFARAGHRPDIVQRTKPWAQVVEESRAQRAARPPVSVDD